MKKFFPIILLLTIPTFFINIFSFNETKTEPEAVSVSGSPAYVIPSGRSVGIKVLCDGVLVIGLGPVYTSSSESCCPAAESGIEEGDYIDKVNGIEVKNSEYLRQIVNLNMGKEVTLSVVREEKEFECEITPVKTVNGDYALGMWIRDSIAGLGTLTFVTADGENYAALGHSVCDTDTGELMDIKDGDLITSTILSEHKGKKGSAGELLGVFDTPQNTVGTVEKNCDFGLYGKVSSKSLAQGKAIPVAAQEEIRPGPAKILSTVVGKTPQEFSVDIVKITPQKEKDIKGLVVKVTDKRLIEKTGGIVQGMSGSPIIQNGKIVGAVTHV